MKMRKLLCLVLSLLLVLSLAACGEKKEKKNKAYESAAKKYMDAMISADYGKIIKLLNPEFVDELKDANDLDDDDWDDIIEDGTEYMQEHHEDLEVYYGGDLKITYKMTDSWDVEDDELAEIQEYYDDWCDIEVTAAKVVEFDVTLKAGGEEEEDTVEICVVKIGSSWYPHDNPLLLFD